MSNKVFDALDKTFQTNQTEIAPPSVPEVSENGSADADFEESRAALKRAMAYNEEAVQGILSIAQNSDNPRAFEVAGQLIKAMAEGAKDMMEVQEKKQKIDKNDGKTTNAAVTNNNLFVGSTSELLRMINKEQGKSIDHDTD